MAENTHITSYCKSCGKDTNQLIVKEYFVPYDPNDYPEELYYQIIKCAGCDYVSFRIMQIDLQNEHYDFNGDLYYPKNVTNYPVPLKGHKEFQWFELAELPIIVKSIYQNTLKSYANDSKILTGIGLRVCIEAVCNDLKINGKSLEIRINQLQKNGYISNGDKSLLHGIRFMGNDSAHDIKEPTSEELEVALRIVEHLFESVYILPEIANGKIQTTVEKYDDFIALLSKNLKSNFNQGDTFGLFKFLENDFRRCQNNISNFESQLISDIQSGNFNLLSLGNKATFNNQSIRQFIVN